MTALPVSDETKAMLASDSDLVGKIVMAGAQMLEVFLCSRGLDVAAAWKLNMEGERTGRSVHFKASSVRSS